MKIILASVFFFVTSLSFAQSGEVTVIKDSRIDGLVSKEGAIDPPAINPQIDGFRIQLFFDSERSAINDARGTFISKYPRIDTYTTYSAPNFFLRVGDFRTRLEAEKVMDDLKSFFPTSFIVQEKINLPRLEKDKRDQ
ncbi:MAG: SPOR domain-containing protein [Crocinitomicaceae bacterium]|nr:SPOR domain-containing protein [Crocinitomicaceae bacterium]